MQQKRSPIPSPVLSSAGLGWNGIEVARFIGHDELSVPPLPKHHAIIHLNRRPLDLTQMLDGRLRKERVHRGEVAIIPAGPPWKWGFRGQTDSDLLPLCLEDAFLREVARSVEVDPEGMEIVPLLGERDPRIEQIGLEDALGEDGWLKALRLEGYAARSRRRPEALQQALFPYHEAWG